MVNWGDESGIPELLRPAPTGPYLDLGTAGPAGRHQKLQAQLELAKFGWPTTSSLDALRAELGALAEPADVKALVEATDQFAGQAIWRPNAPTRLAGSK